MWGLPACLSAGNELTLSLTAIVFTRPSSSRAWGRAFRPWLWVGEHYCTHPQLRAPLYHGTGGGIAQRLSFEAIFRIVLSKYGNPRFFKPQNVKKKIIFLFLWLGLLQWITQVCKFKEKKKVRVEKVAVNFHHLVTQKNLIFFIHICISV